jgi:hypothetical protein
MNTEPPADDQAADQALVERAVSVWVKAQVVHQEPAWEGRPQARAVAEELARRPDCEPLLLGLLGHGSQLVVAYALLTLELMGSPALRSLPAPLLERSSRVKLVMGSFGNGMTVGDLARQVQKRASERHDRSTG